MTCLDVREQFSALVDDALAPGERAALDAHLATCADCRRELQRFRDTVALVRAVAPVRAPAGFVERVLEAARPDPWYRRLVRGLFLPWPVKLPMEAAAIVLVAVGVAVVYRGTREIEPSARLDSIAPAVRQAPERAAPQALTPTPQRETDARRAQNDARKLKTAKDQTQAPEPPKGPAPAETIHKKAAETPERRGRRKARRSSVRARTRDDQGIRPIPARSGAGSARRRAGSPVDAVGHRVIVRVHTSRRFGSIDGERPRRRASRRRGARHAARRRREPPRRHTRPSDPRADGSA